MCGAIANDLLWAENFPEGNTEKALHADVITTAVQNAQWICLLFWGISTGVFRAVDCVYFVLFQFSYDYNRSSPGITPPRINAASERSRWIGFTAPFP